MLKYGYDEEALSIKEKEREDGLEYIIELKDASLKSALQQVSRHFEKDDMYTDVIFYPHQDHVMQVIVREDFHIPFLLELFRRKLVHTLKWVD